MQINNIFRFIFIGIFIFTGMGYAQDYENTVSRVFKNSLTEKQINNIYIQIPDYLNREEEKPQHKKFSDEQGTRVLIVFTDPKILSMTEDLQKGYNFFEKIYSPGLNPIAIAWQRDWKSKYNRIDKMGKVDFPNLHGFVTKAITKTEQPRYVYDYKLFDRENKRGVSVLIASKENYFLSDAEADYIISTIEGLK